MLNNQDSIVIKMRQNNMFQNNLFSQSDQKPLDLLDRLITVGSKIVFRTTIAIALFGTVSCTTNIQLDSSIAAQTQTASVSHNQTEPPFRFAENYNGRKPRTSLGSGLAS
ncbi:hypothetical protein [Okeania hirsuta]|uniref:hypothetical protein n=1 Tax=Okeania hirsuta TaxID=1458930 RepID=UPI000F53612E|nr:hypothetical protein [Okeania hirsuta]